MLNVIVNLDIMAIIVLTKICKICFTVFFHTYIFSCSYIFRFISVLRCVRIHFFYKRTEFIKTTKLDNGQKTRIYRQQQG